jgi:hypothetical protein
VSLGFWIAPVVLIGLAAFLCVASWLERLVPAPARHQPLVIDAIDPVVTVIGADPVRQGVGSRRAEPSTAAALSRKEPTGVARQGAQLLAASLNSQTGVRLP